MIWGAVNLQKKKALTTHQYKCPKCDFTCENEITLNKHTNTTHDDMVKK